LTPWKFIFAGQGISTYFETPGCFKLLLAETTTIGWLTHPDNRSGAIPIVILILEFRDGEHEEDWWES
jgi:hypothetical protein